MYIPSGELVIILRDKLSIKNTFFTSLRFRIIVLLILVSSIPCLLLKTVLLERYEQRAISWRTSEAQSQSVVLANQISGSNYIKEPISEVINAELTQFTNVYDGRIMVIDADYRICKDTFGVEEGKVLLSSEVIRCMEGNSTKRYDREGRYIEVTTPLIEKDGKNEITTGVLLTTISSDIVDETRENLSVLSNVLMSVVIILTAFAGYAISGRMTRPFNNIVRSLEEVTEGYGEEEFREDTYLETGMICDAINKTLARMKSLDDSRQEFVSNVSHELKTPLTSMKVLADSLLAQEDVPVELYQEFMTDIAEEIERENKIINDLLSLVKMDKTAADLNIQSENINELVERILKRLRPIAARQNVEVVFESFRPVIAEVDEVKLSLAISNLVENAIKYNHEEGWVRVSLNADHKYFYIKVADSGMGIPEEAQEHIFERFYRVDKSHSREIGGTGLGLAIARNAVIMHRGSIRLHSEEGEGTTFTVRLPLSYIA